MKYFFFKSYPHSNRFGYNGIIAEPGMSSYFYMLLMSISYLKYHYKKSNQVIMLILILAILFLGTKSGLLFLGILGFVHILILLKKLKYQIFFFITLVTSAFLLKDKLIQLVVNSFSFGPKMYKENGLVNFMTSNRDILFRDALEYVNEHWTILNYIIGGIDFRIRRVEFEVVDLFLFFGIIGLSLYVIVLKKYFLTDKNRPVFVFVFLLFLFIASLSGNLFFSITNSFLFVITFTYVKSCLSRN